MVTVITQRIEFASSPILATDTRVKAWRGLTLFGLQLGAGFSAGLGQKFLGDK